MESRIRLTFPEMGKPLQAFLRSLPQGHLSIPVRKEYQEGEIINLVLTLPELKSEEILRSQVTGADLEKKELGLDLVEPEKVFFLLERLRQIPGYKALMTARTGIIIEMESDDEFQVEIEPVRFPDDEDEDLPEEVPEAPQAGPAWTAAPPQEEPVKSAETNASGPAAADKIDLEGEDPESEARSPEVVIHGPGPQPEAHQKSAHGDGLSEKSETDPKKTKTGGPKKAVKAGPEQEKPKKIKLGISWATESEPETKKEPAQKEPAQAEPEPKAEAEEPKPARGDHEEKAGAATKNPAETGVLGQLQDWLLVKEKGKEKTKEEKREPKEEGKKPVHDVEKLASGPVNTFLQSLVKSMLRSGYYAADHPESALAKEGLFREFTAAIKDANEFGFMVQHKPGMPPDLVITGITEEPVTMKKVMGAGTFELFLPKYLEFFKRKRLLTLVMKNSLSEGHFNHFIDIMSDPTTDQGEAGESGRLLTRMLAESNISEISAIFEDDLISIETDLPWRAQMAVQRLAKDLKVLPLFKGVNAQDMQRIKTMTVQDILRPLRQPTLLKDVILNTYLIARQVKEINEQDLEEAIIENFPLQMLLPTSNLIFVEYGKLKELKAANAKEEEILAHRFSAIKRILKKIAQRVIESEVAGSDQFLEELFNHNIMTFDELPVSVKEKINTKKMVADFQKQPNYWLGKFAEARHKDELELFSGFFSKILPGLIDCKDYQCLYLVTDALHRLPPKKQKIFQEMGNADPIRIVWGDSNILLINHLLLESTETRKGLEQIILLLGEYGIEGVYRKLLQESDPVKRKMLIESLVQFGAKALELFRNILKDPAKSMPLQMICLEALGRAKDQNDAELVRRFLKHSKPELRMEALSAIVRIQGWEAFPAIAGMISDHEPGVVKRLVAVLGGFSAKQKEARAKLRDLAFKEGVSHEIRCQAIQELTRNAPESEQERIEIQEKLMELVCEGEGFRARLKRGLVGGTEETDKLKSAALDLLGKIGGQECLEKLSKLHISGRELQARLEDVLSQLRLRLGQK